MDAATFKRAWEATGEELVRFPVDGPQARAIPDDARRYLSEAGLPEDAAPCLSFGPGLWDPWPPAESATPVCVPIGTNGSGDPIAVFPDGIVGDLNHDAGFAVRYLNRDVATLAECLLSYRALISEVQDAAGPDAWLDGAVPAHLKARFETLLKEIDPAALEPGTLWAEELANWD